jgi:hypothetical protein
MSTNQSESLENYSAAAAAVPDEALLGSLVLFSIGGADVNLEEARQELTNLGLDTGPLRKRLRPIDAFKKATKELEKTFDVEDHVQLKFEVVQVGQDGETSHRHLIARRISTKPGQKRRVVYDASAEMVYHRGSGWVNGAVEDDRVEVVRRDPVGLDLNAEQEAWLAAGLSALAQRIEHWKTHLDSHAVRTYVRDYVTGLHAIQVAPNGGLYFIRQTHKEELGNLAEWVRSHGFEFRRIPLLDLVDQREMLADAFENEALAEVQRLSGEVDKILSDSGRKVRESTYDDYMTAYGELVIKAQDTAEMLNIRSEIATKQIATLKERVMKLTERIDYKKE